MHNLELVINRPEAPEVTQSLSQWLLDHVCPYWLSRVLSEVGFHEGLDQHGGVIHTSQRGVLTQARLTYVFSHAFLLSGNLEMRKAAEHGFKFVGYASEVAGKNNGWYRTISLNGQVIDAARDAYDHAFVIFAMAWYYRATGNIEALMLADRAYAFMENYLADPIHGGFQEEYPPQNGAYKLPRRQNPHMHLLEATLAMYDATRLEVWLERSKMLVSLFVRHFLDQRTGSLGEFFTEDWSPASGKSGAWRDPGHHFEWVWLLSEFYRHTQDERALEMADRMYAFGIKCGVDKAGPLAGIVFDGVDPDGSVVEDSKTLWPQTEFIKACVARYEWRGELHDLDNALFHVALMRQHFFRSDGASWHNQVSPYGEPIQGATPSRVLYHLFLAMAEVIRVSKPNLIDCVSYS